MVEYEPAAAKRPLYLLYLRCAGIDTEFIAVFHLNTSHILLVLYYEFLQSHIDTIDHDLSAVFWTPDHMIFTGVHHVMIAFIFHRNIIQPIPI